MSADPHLLAWYRVADADGPGLTEVLAAHPELATGCWDHPVLGGWCLLGYVVDRGDAGLLEAAIAAGAEPAPARDDPGSTPRRLALTRGRLDLVRLLVDAFPGQPPTPAEAFVLADPAPAPPGEETLLAFQLAVRAGLPAHARAALGALADADPTLAELLVRVSHAADPLTLLLSVGHLTEPWMADGTARGWVRKILAFVDPWLVHDGEVPEAAPALPASRARREANSATTRRFLDALNAGWVPELRAMLADDPGLAHARSLWHMPALYHPGSHGAPTQIEVLDLLLESGADARGPDGHDALHGACWWGSTAVIRRLLEVAPELAHGNGAYHPLLVVGAASRWNEQGDRAAQAEHLELLLDAGADPDAADRWGTTAWGMAHEELRPAIAARGGCEREKVPGIPELFAAAEAGRGDAVRDLLAGTPALRGVYLREEGGSALLVALDRGHRDLAREIAGGELPLDLHEAAALDDVAALGAALARRGIPRARVADHPPERPLHLAAYFGSAAVLDLLLEHGYSPAAPNAADVAGDHVGPPATHDATPLAIAHARGHAAVVERFLADRAAFLVGIAP